MARLKAVDGGATRSLARFTRRGLTSVELLALLLLCAGIQGSRAQDGGALLHKMMDAYQHLATYEVHSNVDFTMSANGRSLKSQSISNIMQYKRPNKLVLVVYNNTQTGTRSIYSDGTTMTIYDALPNHYQFGPTAPNMAGILGLLAARAHVTADLDPLYFLSLNKLPATLSGVKVAGAVTVNGRPSLVVTGVIRSAQTTVQKNKGTIATNVMHWKWYIDRETYLLNKIEAYSDPIKTQVNTRGTGRPEGGSASHQPTISTITINVMMKLRHSISSFKANPPLDDSIFVFKAPANATKSSSVSSVPQGTH